MTGQLFTHYFLTDGIKATTEWPASESYCAAFRQSLAQAYETFRQHHQPNEALTEQDLIRPVLDLLGWTDYLPQQGADRNEDIPDHLLFTDAESKTLAAGTSDPKDRYRHASVVEESKRFGLPSMPATAATGSRSIRLRRTQGEPARPTARSSATFRPPISSPTAGFVGAF